MKKFFRKRNTVPATCTSKDGNLTVLRQDKKKKPCVPKGKRTPKTKSTPKSKKESTKIEAKRRANSTFSPSPIKKTKFARNSDYSDDDDDDDDDDDNPIYKLLNSMRKKNNAKKNKS